jgi:hypothetical protein
MAGAETVNPAAGPLYAPFTAPPTLDQIGTTNPLLRRARKSIVWRWDDMDFALDGAGRIPKIEGAEAHVTWCVKALLSERFMHAVYTHQYGVEFDAVMTGGQARAITEAQARRTIGEALARHPDTQSVRDIAFSWRGDEVYVSLTVVSRATDRPFDLQLAVSAGGL